MPKSSTERSAERRKRLRAAGYKEVRNLWIKPMHEEAIRQVAAEIDRGSTKNKFYRELKRLIQEFKR